MKPVVTIRAGVNSKRIGIDQFQFYSVIGAGMELKYFEQN